MKIDKALKNKTFLLTRSLEDNEDVACVLKEQGAQAISWPVFTYQALELSTRDQDVFKNIHDFDWIVFTSPRSVFYFFEVCQKLGLTSSLSKIKIASIGQATALLLRKKKVTVDLIPQTQTSEGLVEETVFKQSKKLNILIPGAEDARGFFEQKMRDQHRIETISLYKKEFVQFCDQDVAALVNKSVDWFLFYSPSAVKGFIQGLGLEKAQAFLTKTNIAAIGSVTADYIKEQGLPVAVVADEATTEKLIENIIKAYKEVC
ncbi:MAG: uroporphyrinogen-III synthase [bacterium]|nr:uroporphyrinogen-III synthase [bacterium]MBU1918180.1 uroporphyrinogen-III synthase [bacterium]